MAKRSVMEHSFASVPKINSPRSSFYRPYRHTLTMDADYLYPVLVEDVMPGDTAKVPVNLFGRLATPHFPIMDNLYLEWHAFFTPYRILWDNFKKFHGEQVNPGDSIDFTIPTVSSDTARDLTTVSLQNGLHDAMGLPHVASFDLSEVSVLPYRAYNKIWNDWYRDQNLR